MTRPVEVANRFDRISEIYDETREPLSTEAADRLARLLTEHGAGGIIEAGVGTGRIAIPLQRRHMDVVGVDISRMMLQKAKSKGVEGLMLADANSLPFRDKSFECALISHVLHLLEEPSEAFGRLARVTRSAIFVLSRKPGDPFQAPEDGRAPLWQALRKAAEELGYQPPQFGDWGEGFRREAEFLASYPPNETVTIQDVSGVTTLEERLSLIQKRAYGYPSDVPGEVLRAVIEKAKSDVDLKEEVPYRRVEQVGVWNLSGQ